MLDSSKALVGWLGRGIGHVVGAVARASDAWRLRAELSRMSDRQLADIGVSRSEIEAFVRYSVKRSVAQTEAANDDSAEALRQAA